MEPIAPLVQIRQHNLRQIKMQLNQLKFKYEISLSQFHFKQQHIHKSIKSMILHFPLMDDLTLDRYSLGRP